MSKYKFAVYIGRFQPFHNGHLNTISQGFEVADEVIVVLGSSNKPRTYKNPFTDADRKLMISDAVYDSLGESVLFANVRDYLYSDTQWSTEIQEQVYQTIKDSTGSSPSDSEICLIGTGKDGETDSYLKMFPQWRFVDTGNYDVGLHATDIREVLFSNNKTLKFVENVVPKSVYRFLNNFGGSEDHKQLIKEKEFIDSYKKQYEVFPYPPTFVTVDSVVIQAGNILLIKRRSEPGKGLWALPGGFLDANTDKSIESAMLRELKEETGIKVPEKVIRGSIRATKVFDAIGRSARGRTITHAFSVVFSDGEWNLPKLKGSDDAEKAVWVPIAQIKSEMLFEDHWEIIQWALGRA